MENKELYQLIDRKISKEEKRYLSDYLRKNRLKMLIAFWVVLVITVSIIAGIVFFSILAFRELMYMLMMPIPLLMVLIPMLFYLEKRINKVPVLKALKLEGEFRIKSDHKGHSVDYFINNMKVIPPKKWRQLKYLNEKSFVSCEVIPIGIKGSDDIKDFVFLIVTVDGKFSVNRNCKKVGSNENRS